MLLHFGFALIMAIGASASTSSPRFIPLFWRIASCDALVIGHVIEDGEGHRIIAETCLRGDFKRTLEFRWLEGKLMPETEPLKLAPGQRACFILEKKATDEGIAYYTLSQAGSFGAFALEDPMSTFKTGLYDLSLNDVKTITLQDFTKRLKRYASESQSFDNIVERYEERPEGDSEVAAYELYGALAHVKDADIDKALAKIETDLDSESQDWRRRPMDDAKKTLFSRQRAR